MPSYQNRYWQGANTAGSNPSFEQRYGPTDVDLAQRIGQGAQYIMDRPIQASMRAGMEGGRAYANARAEGLNPVRSFARSLDPMAVGVRQGLEGSRPDLRGSQFTGGELSGLGMEMIGDPMNWPTGGGAALGKVGVKLGLKELIPHLAAFGLSKRKFIPKITEGAGGRNMLELFDQAKGLVGRLGYQQTPKGVGFHSIMVTPQYRGKGSGAAYQMFDELDDLVGREAMDQMKMQTPVMPHAKGFFEHLSDKISQDAPNLADRMKQAASMADYY